MAGSLAPTSGMTIYEPIGLFAATAVVSGFAAIPLRQLLIHGRVLDVPGEFASHDQPIPRGGGLLVVAAFFAWFLVDPRVPEFPAIRWVAAGVGAIAIISFIDDIREQSRRLRFAIYSLAAAGFVAAILGRESFAAWEPRWLVALLLWLWVCGYANAFNFIDGINGLAAGQGIVALGFGLVYCWSAPAAGSAAANSLIDLQAILAGALVGFFIHNFPKARLFLGDVGSVTAGFLMAVIAVVAAAEIGWQTGLAIASLHLGPVLDTSLTVLRRLKNGLPVHERHRDFFFHRAIRTGRSHTFVTGVEIAVQLTGALLVSGALLGSNTTTALLVAIAISGLLWLGFFAWCEARFRKQ